MKKNLYAIAALALVAACSKEPAPVAPTNETAATNSQVAAPAAPAADAELQLKLSPQELMVQSNDGSVDHVPFGTEKSRVLQLLAPALGSPIEQGKNEECGNGALDFANFRDGLTVYFQDGVFGGWDVEGRESAKYTTTNGIAVGASRSDVESVGPILIQDSSIGHEFSAGELSGLLTTALPDATVTNLWAGVTCIAR